MDLGNNVSEVGWLLWELEDPQDLDPRHINPYWHPYDDPSTLRLESLERYAGRVYPHNSLSAQLPPRFFWRYIYVEDGGSDEDGDFELEDGDFELEDKGIVEGVFGDRGVDFRGIEVGDFEDGGSEDRGIENAGFEDGGVEASDIVDGDFEDGGVEAGGVFPVLQIWPMAANTAADPDVRTFDYAQGPRVIMPGDRMGQTWSETAQNPGSSTPAQQLNGHATSTHSLQDDWTNDQALIADEDSMNNFNLTSDHVTNTFTPFSNAPAALEETTDQPLTFEELDEYTFLLNDHMDGTSDHHATNSTVNPRPFSPPTRPISSRSWTSNETSLFGSTTTSTYHRNHNGGFVDLTADSSPPLMPVHAGQHHTPHLQASRDTSDSPSNPSKRRKTATGAVKVGAAAKPKPHTEVEEVNLLDIDDDTGLSQLLQKQHANTIKAQQEQEAKPANLANLQCIICMEPMVNITATHCGKSTPHIILYSRIAS